MTRQALVTGILAFVLGLGVSQLVNHPSVAQVPADNAEPAKPAAVQRFRLSTSGAGNTAHMVLVDTQTGECWTRTIPYTNQWQALGSPRNAERP